MLPCSLCHIDADIQYIVARITLTQFSDWIRINYIYYSGLFVYRLTKSTSSLETWPEPETNTFFGVLARSLLFYGRSALSRLPFNRPIGICRYIRPYGTVYPKNYPLGDRHHECCVDQLRSQPWIVRSNATLLLWPIFTVPTCLSVLLLARRKEV